MLGHRYSESPDCFQPIDLGTMFPFSNLEGIRIILVREQVAPMELMGGPDIEVRNPFFPKS